MTDQRADINHRIWQAVSAIPEGKVATYGDVAQMAGLARAARRVGMALRALPADTRIPWHRVLNAKGRISLAKASESHSLQQKRLEAEGICFGEDGAIDLSRFRW